MRYLSKLFRTNDIDPKAYSVDLRQKIVEAYGRGGIFQRKLAQKFDVTRSFV